MRDKLKFCREQINLAFSKKHIYSPASLVWFATVFFSFPSGYKTIRMSQMLTMPHPRYLKTFTPALVVEIPV